MNKQNVTACETTPTDGEWGKRRWSMHEWEVFSLRPNNIKSLVAGPMLEGDANLLVAAKDLLAACEEFVREVEAGETRSTKSYEQMKKAIARAKGLKK